MSKRLLFSLFSLKSFIQRPADKEKEGKRILAADKTSKENTWKKYIIHILWDLRRFQIDRERQRAGPKES